MLPLGLRLLGESEERNDHRTDNHQAAPWTHPDASGANRQSSLSLSLSDLPLSSASSPLDPPNVQADLPARRSAPACQADMLLDELSLLSLLLLSPPPPAPPAPHLPPHRTCITTTSELQHYPINWWGSVV